MTTKTSIHTIYKLPNGERVPATTTIIGVLDKPALLKWAWQCGVDGIDYLKARDNAGDIGTLAHYLILCHLKGETPDTSEYSPDNLARAETCLLKYWEWEHEHHLRLFKAEWPLVSEQYRYGGTLDFLGLTDDNQLWLVDHKTGKGIFPDMGYQLAAYRQLVREAGFEVDTARILRIGRDPNEGFEERVFTPAQLDVGWEIFTHCRAIYDLKKEAR